MRFKMKYLRQIHPRYHKSLKDEKSRILDEFCKVCGYVRKYAIRKINAPLPDLKAPKTVPSYIHKRKYLKETVSMLEIIWEAANYLCSVRLHAAIPIWLPHLKNRYHISDKVINQLMTISPSTIDRALKPKKLKLKRKLYGTTKPGSLLKNQIPIKTVSWDINKPGFLEIDLVSHSGNSAEGDFIHSCNSTDILSTWTETRAVMGKGQHNTKEAIDDIRNSLPFKLLGIDSDNGSEFINHHLLKYCSNLNIQFTRSRPYKKNDNAYIEQKNWTCVRKIFGYLRYSSPEALSAMNDLYKNELKFLQNLFLPSQKLIKKTIIGSRYFRKYDSPQTPLQRLITSKSKNIYKVKLNYYIRLFNSLDPFTLSMHIDKKINRIFRLASKSQPLKNQKLKAA